MARNFYPFFRAGNRFLEFQREIVAKIFAARVAAPPPAAAKKFAENVTENIFKSAGEIKTAASKWSTITECGMAELIVLSTLLRRRIEPSKLRKSP